MHTFRSTHSVMKLTNSAHFFGGAALASRDALVTGRAAQRHRIALLALLSSTRRLHRTRDQLITLLWPEVDAERGRKMLSDAIYRVNQGLGGDVLLASGDDVRINRAQLHCDVAELEAAADAQDWARVMELYRGAFLDGFYVPGSPDFDQWIDAERAHYLRTASLACERLAAAARDANDFSGAAQWWQRLATLVPDDSRVAMELMRATEAAGNRAAAIRHAREHIAVVRDSLGLNADPGVQALATQIARRSATPATTGTTVAVLPFRSVNAVTDNSCPTSYFVDGITEELIFLLSRVEGLHVASRTSSFAFRERNLDVREVARQLNVEWIVEGSVRRTEHDVRISAQLVDAKSGFHMWAEAFERPVHDVVAMQSDLASAITARLAPTADATTNATLMRSPTREPSADAYDLFLQARYQWHRRTESSLSTAISQFDAVVAREPSYARAWSGLADSYAVMAFHDFLPPTVASPRADAAARRAIELDPTLAGPHATLANANTHYWWNWQAAEEGFNRALALEPLYASTHQWYSNLLTASGRFADAERTMRRAAELDPLSMVARAAIGWGMLFADQPDRAAHHLMGVLQLDPDFCLANFWMGLAKLQGGRADSALPYIERALLLNSALVYRSPVGLSALARVHAARGDDVSARRVLNELLDQERAGRYVSSFLVGRVHLALGDVGESLNRFERAFDERSHAMAYIHVDPQLMPLAHEPRFQQLQARVGNGVQQTTAGSATVLAVA